MLSALSAARVSCCLLALLSGVMRPRALGVLSHVRVLLVANPMLVAAVLAFLRVPCSRVHPPPAYARA